MSGTNPKFNPKSGSQSGSDHTGPSKKWEDFLRKGVFTLGTALEKAVGHVNKIKDNVSKASAEPTPVLALEAQIQIQKLKELINFSADRIAIASIPSLVDKTAFELREGPSTLVAKLKERGASVAIHADMGTSAGSYGAPSKNVNTIRSASWRLPFEDGFFDFFVSVVANQYQGDISKTIKELSRLLVIGGEGVVFDFHPFGLFAKRGALRLKPSESSIKGLEDYYKICKQANLKITDAKETFVDDSVRGLFVTEEEKSAFKMVKNSPLLIVLFVKKGG